MTRNDALKAPCPFQLGKLCVADKCPKWRWEETCSGAYCQDKGGSLRVEHGDAVDLCLGCPGREGYCS